MKIMRKDEQIADKILLEFLSKFRGLCVSMHVNIFRETLVSHVVAKKKI